MSLLGCLIIEPANVVNVRRTVTADDFYDVRHARIFDTIATVYAEDGQVDAVTLSNSLGVDDDGVPAIGVEYLVKLAEETPSPIGYEYYAKIVSDKSKLRRLIKVAGNIAYEAYNADADDTDKTIAWAFEQISPLARMTGGEESVSLQVAADKVIEALNIGRPTNLRTGFDLFDGVCGGVPRSGIWTILGYPGGGKTTFALASALNFARGLPSDGDNPEQPRTVVRYYSVEQGPMRAAATLLSQASGVGVHKLINQGGATQEQKQAVADAASGFAKCDFAFIEQSMDPNQLMTECAALATQHPHGVLVCDYIQDMPPFGKFIETTPRMTESMRILARIARELGWLVICVSQVSKSAGNANLSPKMSDGLGSSAIEQRSDLISYVWRPHIREEKPIVDADSNFGAEPELITQWKARRARTRIGVLKNKYGPSGYADMQFDADAMRFIPPTDAVKYYWETIENG
jgi:replicative DNA helicase